MRGKQAGLKPINSDCINRRDKRWRSLTRPKGGGQPFGDGAQRRFVQKVSPGLQADIPGGQIQANNQLLGLLLRVGYFLVFFWLFVMRAENFAPLVVEILRQ